MRRKNRNSIRLAILFVPLAAFLITVLPSFADIFFLKNGDKLEGSLVEENSENVIINLDYGTVTFKKSEIDRIEAKPFEKKPKDKPQKQDAGDLIEYNGRKYTKERFDRLVKQSGLQNYNGKWVTEHEKMGIQLEKSQGYANIQKVVEYAALAVVSVKIDENKLGSGVLISPNGLLITNYHVVKDAKSIKVKLYNDESEYSGRVVSFKEFYDLALVSIGGTGRPFLKLADPDAIKTGDAVIALGNPFGLATTATTGIISSVRELKDFPGADKANLSRWQENMKLIQTDAAVNPGNSGGPLVNKEGKIVGINTFGISKSVAEGLNFAIHAREIGNVYSDYFTE